MAAVLGSNSAHEPSPANEYTPLFSGSRRADEGDVLANKFAVNVRGHSTVLTAIVGAMLSSCIIVSIMYFPLSTTEPLYGAAWSSKAEPFSTVDPTELGIMSIGRLANSKPGKILANVISKDPHSMMPDTPLPTNTWYQNLILGDENTNPENKIFQIPHIIDTAGFIPGIRTHPAHLQANDRMIMMNFEPESGLALGAVETFQKQHYVHRHQGADAVEFSKLALELEWVTDEYQQSGTGATMRTPIVRGSPYTTMKYYSSTPRLFSERHLSGPIVIDNNPNGATLTCGVGYGNFSAQPELVQRELKIQFDTSDMTWLVFVSEPTEFVCSAHVLPEDQGISIPGVVPVHDPVHGSFFDLKATKPMTKGMVRVAMSNNCTTGQNPQHCTEKQPRDQSAYEQLLRTHSPIYPTAQADIEFTFPVFSSEEEELRLILNWRPANMFDFASEEGTSDDATMQIRSESGLAVPELELLMFALPHHQERLRPTAASSNAVQSVGCQTNLHGTACPVLGSSWSLVEHLHRTSFSAPRAPRAEMVAAIQQALKKDITYMPPQNYMEGAGDTYFSGKMLAKLARILIVASEVGGVTQEEFQRALDTLRQGVEIWYSPAAGSPLLYDRAWGGMVTCGCTYVYENGRGFCANSYPDCPALVDFGQNFGAGYYNDHHYHFGYHIYAAAVVAKFDAEWARRFHQHVLLLVRDIVNPSTGDEYFPTWRHKDWYLGFSWASGIVTLGGKPYPNGRNQESASEAIAAYEAVALYGDVMTTVFQGSANPEDARLLDTAMRIRDMGRLLMATEIRSMLTYWHVQAPNTPGVARVYPEVFAPKVVGMMWSTLAQLQTWFGNEAWKSYGIQLIPFTPASELRDSGTWVAEMLPDMKASCEADLNCAGSGWNVLIYACMGTLGDWQNAWRGAASLDESAFLDAGGNGHSLSNTLWYIATRPTVTSVPVPFDPTSSGGKVE